MTINDIDLEQEIRRLHNYGGKLDQLTRDGMVGNLEDALAIIEISARDARRRLREIARERV